MNQSQTRFLSYFCPQCRQAVVAQRENFALLASPARISCPCGRSHLTVSCAPHQVELEVPCLTCQKTHRVSCPTQPFFHQRALAFSCQQSGLDCCYVGEEQAVYQSMARLEEIQDRLAHGAPQDSPFVNDWMMREVLAELKDIASRRAIQCDCGGQQCTIQVQSSCVLLQCIQCGGELRIPAATADDLERLCCQTHLRIRGGERP